MIILISGKQGSGKTTLAKSITKRINNNSAAHAYNLTFAESLYRMHDFCWGLLKDNGIEMPFIKDGYLLQLLGTEWGRNKIDPDIWIKLLKSIIEKLKARQPKKYALFFIISDCRFKNEANAFDHAIKIRLEANELSRKSRVEMWRDTTSHPSEIDLDDYQFDLTIDTYANSASQTEELVWKAIVSFHNVGKIE